MYFLFLRALKLYSTAFLEALRFANNNPLGLQRILFLCFIFPPFFLLQILHQIGLILDTIFFPNFKNQAREPSLFIIGIPRSGTTFIHRQLSKRLNCTTFSTWEALFAPSILEKYIIGILAQIDQLFGKIFSRSLNFFIKVLGGNFHKIHSVLLEEPEEDYLTLLPVASCFILLFAFPNSKELKNLISIDSFTQKEQHALLNYYQSIILRHRYFHKSSELFLSKNAAFSTWLPQLKKTFPKAKFILSIREPQTAISSQLSALKSARNTFGTDPRGTETQAIILAAFKAAYKSIYDFSRRSQAGSFALINQAQLRETPDEILNKALNSIGIEVSKKPLSVSKASKSSSHKHQTFTLEKSQIDPSIFEYYELILESFINNE